MLKKYWIVVLCALFLLHSPLAFADEEENMEAWDEEEAEAEEAVDMSDEEAVDMDDEANKHQRPEFEHMAGKMGAKMCAAIYMSKEAIYPGDDDPEEVKQLKLAQWKELIKFITYDRTAYADLVIADTGSAEPQMWFFKSKDQETAFTVLEAKKNGRIDKEQMEKMIHIVIPDDAALEKYLADSPPLSLEGKSQQDIRGELADHNVIRKEAEVTEAADDDEEEETGPDGEKKPRRGKKKYGGWKKRRQERLKKEKKQEKERRKSFQPYIRMGHNVGLDLPMPLLLAISVGGLCGLVWLGMSLKHVLDSKKDKQDQRRLKADKKANKKAKKRN